MKTSEIRLTLLADSQSSSAFTVVEDSPTFLATSVSYSIVSCRVSLPCSAATERALPSNAGDMLMLSVAWARKLARQSCKEFRVCTSALEASRSPHAEAQWLSKMECKHTSHHQHAISHQLPNLIDCPTTRIPCPICPYNNCRYNRSISRSTSHLTQPGLV